MEKKTVTDERRTGAKFYTVEPCASSNAYEIKLRDKKINLDHVNIGETIAKTPAVLVSKFENCSLSIYASGRIMIKGIGKEKANADSISEKIISELECSGALI
ncbi:MAG: hypothetical protein AABW86_03380 [Candidatus Micrarchaeota archaeon]